MAVTVKTEPRAGWPAVPHRPESGDAAVTGVEHVDCINEEEPLFLLFLLLSEEGFYYVHRALYPILEAGAQLHIAACILGLGAGDLKDVLGKEPAQDLADPDWPDA